MLFAKTTDVSLSSADTERFWLAAPPLLAPISMAGAARPRTRSPHPPHAEPEPLPLQRNGSSQNTSRETLVPRGAAAAGAPGHQGPAHKVLRSVQ